MLAPRVNKLKKQKIGNQSDKLFAALQEALGLYVYGLFDPSRKEIFYVGKGGGSVKGNSRVLYHLKEARRFADSDTTESEPSSKVARILQIWNSGNDVKWCIIRHGISDQQTCDQIEAAVIDVLQISSQGLTNRVSGTGSKRFGIKWHSDATNLMFPPVNPAKKFEIVFLFHIGTLKGSRKDLYDSTRHYWRVAQRWQDAKGAIALAIYDKSSIGGFHIDEWHKKFGKFEFTGKKLSDRNELVFRDFRQIIEHSGSWKWGQYLVVEFDGNGRFRILRGSSNKEWLWIE
jgi:hypothetical protein